MLKPKEIGEISLALWYLPLAKLQEVRALVMTLKQQHGYPEPLDDSDEWTAEDMRELTEAAMRRGETEVPWEEGRGDAQAG